MNLYHVTKKKTKVTHEYRICLLRNYFNTMFNPVYYVLYYGSKTSRHAVNYKKILANITNKALQMVSTIADKITDYNKDALLQSFSFMAAYTFSVGLSSGDCNKQSMWWLYFIISLWFLCSRSLSSCNIQLSVLRLNSFRLT